MVRHSRQVCGRLPGAPACGSELPEGTGYASSWLHAGVHLSNSLSHVHVLPWWYWSSGATSTHPHYLPGSEGKVHSKPGRFCIAEALANEWPFGDAPVPWILPEGYRNPKGTVLDFPGRDSQDEEDSPSKGSGVTPLTIPKPIGSTAQDDADDEDDEGFETVGDDKEVHGDQVLVSKPEHSSSDGKGKMFESEEDDDPEVQEQIKAVLASSGPLGDLQLSESEDESESDSPGDDDNEGDPNETKQHYKDQEDEAGKDSGLRPDSSTVVTDPPAMPGNPGNLNSSYPGAPATDAQPT